MNRFIRRGLPSFRKPPVTRSNNMRAIRSSGNRTTERRLVSLLISARLRGWKLRPEEVPGVPDVVFHRHHLAVFGDGCFWHGCPTCGHIPKTNRAYWRAKIARNRARDARITRQLRTLGFSVVRLWECDLRTRASACIRRIEEALRGKRSK